MYRGKGTITVFLSLVSILLLSLFCTMIESARVQGARVQAAAAFDMGLFSVFGEYDSVLLEEYDLWFLDGTCGNAKFSEETLETKLKDFIYPNLHPAEDIEETGYWNLFPAEVDSCQVEKYALATDDGGRVFYQQAVENEKNLAAGNLIKGVLKNKEKLKEQEKQGEDYQKADELAEENLQKAQEEQKMAEVGNEGEQETEDMEYVQNTTGENPVEIIKKWKKMGVLSLVIKDLSEISDRELTIKNLPSERKLREGTLEIEGMEESVASETLFLSYLNRHFSNAAEKKEGKGLSYELEYFLAGEKSDMENLKKIVNKLLLLREGTNYTCIASSVVMRKEALALAGSIAGAVAVPALTAALQQTLMLGWAYGESLLDVRVLLAGGKVPLIKTEKDWKLSLSNFGKLEELLTECDKGEGTGQSYEEYLLGLLAVAKKEKRNLRVLDLIEAYRRMEEGGENFRADALIAEMEAECVFELKPVFLTVPAAFMNISNQGIRYEIKGRYGYMEGGA